MVWMQRARGYPSVVQIHEVCWFKHLYILKISKFCTKIIYYLNILWAFNLEIHYFSQRLYYKRFKMRVPNWRRINFHFKMFVKQIKMTSIKIKMYQLVTIVFKSKLMQVKQYHFYVEEKKLSLKVLCQMLQ